MLQNIRDNIQGVAAKIIVGLMIVPFALYGIDFLFSGGGETAVATVNGEEVTEPELNQALALQKRRLLSMLGDNIDPSMLDDAVLRKPALDSLIRQKILLQAADDAGVAVPDSVLNSNITQMPEFQEDGRFSPQRYEQTLRAQGFSPKLFRQLLRSDLLIEQINQGVAGSVFLTDFQRNMAVKLGDQKRTFHYLRLDTDHFAEQAEVSEEEIKRYYEENSARFKTAESVKLSYLELRESDFYEPVPESDLRAAYQREVRALEDQVERKAAHILVQVGGERDRDQALQRINEARAKLEAGESFAEVAETFSDDFGSAQQGGELGYSAGDTFPESFEQALAQLSEGEVSDVVETDAGLHLVKLLEVRRPEIPEFADRREAIEKRLQSQAAQPRLIAEVENLKDLVFNADGLRQPAKDIGLEVKQTDWLSPNDRSGLMAHAAVRNAAFNPELRERNLNSEVFELSPERFVVVHPAQYRPPALKPLEDVRTDIVAALKQEKGRERAAQLGQSLLDELRSGKTAEAVAKAYEGVEWQVAVRAGRQDPSVEEAVRRKAFELPRPGEGGEPVLATLSGKDGDPLVVQLMAVFDGEKSLVGDKRRRELHASAERVQASQSFNAYFASLMRSAEVKIN